MTGKINDGSNGSVAVDSYHRYKEDVAIIKEMGLDAYRFSISWSRILPNGKRSGGVNMEGVTYYNNLINELIANGIKPFVTIFHWDLPQTLEDEYEGFLSRRIINDFRDYAEICFEYFGDRVKHWITLNEPWSYIYGGYTTGSFAPGRCSKWQQLNCIDGDSATEPYLVTHHLLLAHAAAVKSYRKIYQVSQKGVIGISLVSNWYVPYSASKHNKRAAQRALDFMFGLFMDPLTNGDYPRSLRSLVPDRLPKFTNLESKMLNGSFDFLGLNYYTARYASYAPELRTQNSSYITDSCVKLSSERDGVPIGPMAASEWLYIYPKGIYRLLLYIKSRYRNPIIYITENGVDEADNASLPLTEALADDLRVQYHSHHLHFVLKAIKDGTNVKGYFVWSLLDNFEWRWGYTVRFGMVYVDFRDGLKRFPKLSSKWFSYFLKR